VSITSL